MMSLTQRNQRSFSQILKAFATVDPQNLNENTQCFNLVKGEWTNNSENKFIVDPMNGKRMYKYPDVVGNEIDPFVSSLSGVPKTGLHNPFRNKERYLMLGEVNRRLVEAMQNKDVSEFFIRCMQRTCPKSYA